MSDQSHSIVDLIADGASKRQTVEQRIEKRLEVLREWHREGIPAGRKIPKDLKAVRLWDDPELGIQPIMSPNEFTTTHRIHGSRVRDVSGPLTDLKERFSRPSRVAVRQGSKAATKFDIKAANRQLEAVVSRWHTERELRLQETKRADSAEARSILLLKENSEKDRLIADLRRQLAMLQGLHTVK